MLDVLIMGAGVIGTATARELSKYNLDVLVVDKKTDISEGTSKANSGIVHAGHDCKPGTLKAQLNVRGNELYTTLCEDLEIPFRRNGAFVLCFNEEQHSEIVSLYEKAVKNKVPDVKIIFKDEILELEPNINDDVYSALYAKSSGIISPYEATVAFAENSYANGVKYELKTEVLDIKKVNDYFTVKTNKGELQAKIVINATGIYSDYFNNLVSSKKYEIIPTKGEYMLLDKTAKYLTDRTLFPLPTKLGKGILVTPTVHNNVLIGPTSTGIEEKESLETTNDKLDYILNSTSNTMKSIPRNKIITSFAGNRATLKDEYDFIIGESDVEGFINALGINSPGLSCAPSIGEYIKDIVVEKIKPTLKSTFISKRKRITVFNELSIEEQNELIKQNKAYGKIICRCESVTEAEIIDSIKRPLGATTIDGVKRRTRLSMGRCQGGFCTSKVMEILARELDIDITEVSKFGENSEILKG